MEKIKSLLRSDKEDETTTGSGNTSSNVGSHTAGTTGTTTHPTSTTTTSGEEGINPGGIGRQVLNPGGDKYNEAAYGPSGSTSAQEQLPPSVGADQTLYTDPAAKKKEHGVLRQLLNPGGDKYDSAVYGENASTTAPAVPEQGLYSSPAAEKDGGVLRQILNPGNDKYDSVAHGTTATNHPAALEGDLSTRNTTGATTGSSTGAGSSALPGSFPSDTNSANLAEPLRRPAVPGSFPSESSFVSPPETTAGVSSATSHQQQQQPSSHGQEALAGGVGAASVASAEGLTHRQYNQFYEQERGLGSSSTTQSAAGASNIGDSRLGPLPASTHESSSTAPSARALAAEEANQEGLSHHVYNQYGNKPTNAGSTGSAATAGAVGGASALGAHETGTHSGATSGLNTTRQAEGDLPTIPATGGKFLGDEGSSNVGSSTTGTSGERSFPLSGGSTTAAAIDPTSGARPTGATSSHTGLNDGRAGLAGAATAATAASGTSGGRESESADWPSHDHLGLGHKYTGPEYGEDDTPIKGVEAAKGPHTTMIGNLLDPNLPGGGSTGVSGSTTSGTTGTTGSHHLGRDAAAVGGVGAAGLAAGEASRHHQGDSTGPAPNTIGPHKSDILNVLDPRVQPDPSKMHGSGPDATGPASNTIGPHDKDYKNILDPRVTPAMSSQNREHAPPSATAASATSGTTSESHLGRNAAIGGVGAAGAGLAAREAFSHQSGTAATGATGSSTGYNDHVSSSSGGVQDPAAGAYGQPSLRSPADAASASTTTGASGTGNQHHLGRDAAVVGAGAGATGLGAHEVSKHHDHDAGNVSLGAHDPSTHHGGHEHHDGEHKQGEHHHGRDAGIAAGAAGAGGAAYEAERHRHADQHEKGARDTPSIFNTGVKDAAAPTGGATIGTASGQTDTVPSSDASATTTGRQFDDIAHHDQHHHKARDALVTGTAGGGAGYVAGVAEEHRHMEERAAQQPHVGQHQTGEYSSGGVHTSAHGHEDEHHKEKKQGFISKLLHRNKDSSHTDDRETAEERFAEDHKLHDRSRIAGTDSATGHAAGGVVGGVEPRDATLDALSGGGNGNDVAGDIGRLEHPHERNRLHKDPPTH